jgi:probable DNA metabolism protein
VGDHIFLYDGSFEGLLTVIFEAYERRIWPRSIQEIAHRQDEFFADTLLVATDRAKANRVWRGLGKKLSEGARTGLYHAFLSERPGIELLVAEYARLAFSLEENVEEYFTENCVLEINQIRQRVWREKHRMEAFVRFRKTADGTYFSLIDPDFNVLPLITRHFEDRYADQPWVIYDSRRRYGIYYDLETTHEITFAGSMISGRSNRLPAEILDSQEKQYEELWQVFFDSVNIPERKNIKLHLRHLPKRYWKYLNEKQPRNGNKRLGHI